MNNAIQFEDRVSRSRSKHEGESSAEVCDRLSRTRVYSQRQLPTDHDYAVPPREYQLDQSSPLPATAAADLVLEVQRQKQPKRFADIDWSHHINFRLAHQPDTTRKIGLSGIVSLAAWTARIAREALIKRRRVRSVAMRIRMQRSLARSLMKSTSRFLPVLLSGILFWPIAVHSQGSAQDFTCEDGSGDYSTRFFTGVSVVVGPVRKGSFAERACTAKLVWNTQEISVASDAGQVGIDVLGADLGFGMPVVAFQIDKSGSGSDRTYQIYSLARSPRLLYTIKGASSYRAADTDLDGRIEIWTDDAAAVDGFERIPSVDLDFAPIVVFRFKKGRLVDVGPEFQSYYDAQIVKLRSQVSEHDLAAFKGSDGQLSATLHRSGEDLHRLVRTKISILEIVWAYTYSGREHEAWSALEAMWPPEDLERIRAAISTVRQRGLLRNLDRPGRSPRRGHQVKIYDAVSTSTIVGYSPLVGAPDSSQSEPPLIQPKSILLRRPPPSPDEPFRSANEVVELVVDAAGKVRSAKIINGTDNPLVEASAGWQFIPAFRNGSPVACRFRLSVWALK
jgi:hypothetical protein